MEKNLFEHAKEMMMNFRNDPSNQQNHDNANTEAVRQAIQSAYNEATPEQKSQLEHFEQQLDEQLH